MDRMHYKIVDWNELDWTGLKHPRLDKIYTLLVL